MLIFNYLYTTYMHKKAHDNYIVVVFDDKFLERTVQLLDILVFRCNERPENVFRDVLVFKILSWTKFQFRSPIDVNRSPLRK